MGPGVEIGRESAGDIGKARGLLSFPNGRIYVAQGFRQSRIAEPEGEELAIKPVLLKVAILYKVLNLDSSFQKYKLYAESYGTAHLKSSNSMNYF